MATRINTKFVLILAGVLVVLTAGVVYAVMRWHKTAAEHVQIAESAYAEAQRLLEAGEIEDANGMLNRSSKNFYAAKQKDGLNNEHLYNFIKARSRVVCSDLTLAYNELNAIVSIGALGIHNTPNASEQDREYLYELLSDWHRRDPVLRALSPIGLMNRYTEDRLKSFPDDPVAKRYRAVVESYLVLNETDADDRLDQLELIRAQVSEHPEDPWLHLALARYHVFNARRQYLANGNTYSPQVTASFVRARESIAQAVSLSQDNPAAMVQALALLMDVRTNDQDAIAALLAERVELAQALKTVLSDKPARDKLYVAELSTAASLMRNIGRGTEQRPFDGGAAALALAQAVVEDRPGDPAAYALLGQLLREQNELDESETVIERGLAIERRTNGLQFVRDQLARVEMLSGLAEVKLSLAADPELDGPSREALLSEAAALADRLEAAQSPNTDTRDARVNLLRGRMALIRGRADEAVKLLDRANQAYDGRDPQTLQYLAQAHGQLRNTSRVIELYEQIVQLNPTTRQRLNLANLYLSQRQASALDRAEGHLKVFLTQYPTNLSGVRMLANLFAQRDQTDKAIEVLEQVDSEKFPQVLDDIARYRAAAGDTTGVIAMLREKIADRAEGEPMDLALVTQLINVLPGVDDKSAELDRLVREGLSPEVARIMQKLVRTGRLDLEDELTLLEIRGLAPAELALRKSQVYARYQMPEESKKFLDQAAELSPDDPLVLQSRFASALQRADWAGANQAIDDILDLPADDRPAGAVADGAFMRARVRAAQASEMAPGAARDQAFLDAAARYKRALDTYPFHAEGWLQLGKVQLIQGNYFGAKSSFGEALSLQNNDTEVLANMALAEVNTGELPLALSRYEQILQLEPNHPTALDRFAAIAVQMGMTDQAIQMREQMRDRRPRDIENRRALSLLYAQAEQYDKAQAQIEDVIEIQGKTLSNVRALSRVLMQADRPDRAIQAVTDYLADRGDQAQWQDYLVLAEAYQRAGRTGEADTAFARAAELEGPDSTQAMQAWASAMLGRGERERALSLYEQLSNQQPDNLELKAQASQLMIQNQQFEKGEALAKSMPQSPQRYQLLIQAAVGTDPSLGNAIQQAREGVQAYPEHLGLRVQLGRLLLNQQTRREPGQRDLAELTRLADELVADFPDQVEPKMLAADVLVAKESEDQAIALLQEVRSIAPSHAGTNERLYNLWMLEARRLATPDPSASREAAARALEVVMGLMEARPGEARLNRSAGAAASLAGRAELAAQYHAKAFESSGSEEDFTNLVLALLNAGRGREARAMLESPEHASKVNQSLYLRALRGRALAQAGEPAMAAALFRNTLSESKDDAQARDTLLQQAANAFANQPDQMVKLVNDVFRDARPQSADLMLSTVLINNQRYDEAARVLAAYENTASDTPARQIELLMRLALARQESGSLEKAKATYERSLAMIEQEDGLVSVNQQVQLLNNLAYLLADRMAGYEQQAVDYARRAMELLPRDESPQTVALIRDTLGWALYKAGQTEQAIRQLERSIDQMPLSANQWHLGKIRLAQGDHNRALALLDAAVKQARADKDAAMIAETEKWYAKALNAGAD